MVIRTNEQPITVCQIQQRPWTPTVRRGTIAAEYKSPGPAIVNLPSTFGGTSHYDTTRSKAPSFTFGGKREDKLDKTIPGVGTYNISGLSSTGKETVAAPFISGRMKVPEPFKTPAPGAYSPEKSDKAVGSAQPAFTFGLKGKDNKVDDIPAPGTYCPEKGDRAVGMVQPAFTFGMKAKENKIDAVPAPNAYSIPSLVGGPRDSVHHQSPSYSMGAKLNDSFNAVCKHSPGPGKYTVPGPEIYKSKSPSYTLSSRTNMPKDTSPKPGPGTHSPEKVMMKNGPAYTFGVRHSPYISGLPDKKP